VLKAVQGLGDLAVSSHLQKQAGGSDCNDVGVVSTKLYKYQQ